MRTLQVCLDLDDSGDKVISRPFWTTVLIAHLKKKTHNHSCRPTLILMVGSSTPNQRRSFLDGCICPLKEISLQRNQSGQSSRTIQPRTKRESMCMKSVETTRPLRGVALFDGKCILTDEDAQEATVRAYHSANHGTIIVGIPRIASKGHFGFCAALCTEQHERGALYMMTLTDLEETLSEEQHMALETLHRVEGSAWLGRDLRQMGRVLG